MLSPCGPQHGGPALVPGAQQLLDGVQRRERLPARRRVHHLRLPLGGHGDPRTRRLRYAVGAAPAQRQGRLARQHHRARRGRQQQTPVQQPAQMGRGLGRHLAVRRAPHQPRQHLPGRLGRPFQQLRDPLPVGEEAAESGHRRHRVVGVGQPGRRQDRLDTPRRHARGRLRHRGAQPRRRGVRGGRRQQFAGGAHQPQPVLAAPDQRPLPQQRHRGGQRPGHLLVPVVPGEQVQQLLVRGRVRRHRQRLGRLEGEPVQVLQGPQHRGTRPCAGRQLGHVGGDRVEQVGAGPEQGPQRGVVALAQGLRQRPRSRVRRLTVPVLLLSAHPAHGSGPRPLTAPTGPNRHRSVGGA